MKQLYLLTAFFCLSQTLSAQLSDTARKSGTDTLRVGNIVILTKGDHDQPASDSVKREKDKSFSIRFGRKSKKALSNISTNWLILDLGFNNFNDQTNYAAAKAGNYIVDNPASNFPISASDFQLRASKSINVNIWLFMQRMNLVKHHINLKYGLGIELNNYRFRSQLSFKEPGFPPYYAGNTAIQHAFIIRDSINFSKNKLAADYVTVPFMINFCSNPGDPHRGISLSVGISAGYLYSQRNKQVSNERGTQTNKGDYDLKEFKFSYIAEIGLGPLRLYGSYSPTSIFKQGLDIQTYNVGVRFSNW